MREGKRTSRVYTDVTSQGRYDSLLIINVHTQMGSRPADWGFILKEEKTDGQGGTPRHLRHAALFMVPRFIKFYPVLQPFLTQMLPLQAGNHVNIFSITILCKSHPALGHWCVQMTLTSPWIQFHNSEGLDRGHLQRDRRTGPLLLDATSSLKCTTLYVNLRIPLPAFLF